MLAQTHDTEADTGPKAAGLERLCVATRSVRPVGEMIRFVVAPDGMLTPDLRRNLPGRGVWVTARRQAVADAVKRSAFARSLRAAVKVPADLPGLVDRLMVRAALDSLSIARKAGQVLAGFAKVEAAIADGPVVALLHAADAGTDGVRKIEAAAKRRFGAGTEQIETVNGFSSAELDLALGLPNVVHAALLAGGASDTFLARWRVLERFRTPGLDSAGKQDEEAGQPNAAVLELGSE